MGVGTVTTREKAESKGKCTAGQSSGQVMLVPLDQCPGQGVHSCGHGVNPLGVVFVFLREFDVSIVVLDLNGVGQAPKQKGDSSRTISPCSSNSRKVFTARFCPAQVWEISTQKSSLFRSSQRRMAKSVALCPS